MWPIWWPLLPIILFGIIFNVLMQTNPLAFRSDQYAVQALVYIAASAAPVALLTLLSDRIALRLRYRALKEFADRVARDFPFTEIKKDEEEVFEQAVKNMDFYKNKLNEAVERGDRRTAEQYKQRIGSLEGKWK
jgi:hypothetical protein